MLQLKRDSIGTTGNHPFFGVQGDGLPFRSLSEDVTEDEPAAFREGRWMEARDLKPEDVLKAKPGMRPVL